MAAVVKYAGIEFQGYIVAPLSLGAVEQYRAGILAWKGDLSPESIALCIDMLHHAIARNYPGFTRAEAAELVDLGSMPEVMEMLMDVGGFKRKELDAGKAPPAMATAETSTGPGSTPTSPPAPAGPGQ